MERNIARQQAAFQELLEEYGDEVFDVADDQFLCKGTAAKRVAIRVCHCSRGNAKDRQGTNMVKRGTVCKEAYDAILCTQFIHGLQNQRVHACLTSMHPLQMTFKRLRRELRVIEAAERLNMNQAADEQTNSLDQQAADRTVAAQHCQKPRQACWTSGSRHET